MGSSVTAGHDTKFELSFPILTGKVMEAPFKMLDIELQSYNVAMGNNPCLPYDTCVHAFAGKDADIVHWEQTFNCGENDGNKKVEFEQFIRQSWTLPNHAVVVFSRSITPNWNKNDCEPDKIKPMPALSNADKEVLTLASDNPMKLATEHNLKSHMGTFSAIKEMMQVYKMTGVQTFIHEHYEKYKCHGPYDKDWGCCSASWHPSIKGHQLRADHHAYFWLLIFRDALDSLLKIDNFEEAVKKVTKHIQTEHKHLPAEPLHKSNFGEGLSCYTSFEPIRDESLNLLNLVRSNKEVDGKKPFQIG